MALVVNPQALPVNSVDELIKELRAKPGKYNFSSPGVGTLQHLGMELFRQEFKLDVLHVPYRGAAPRDHRPHHRAGAVHLSAGQLGAAAGGGRQAAHARGRKLQAHRMAPDVPSLNELGYPSLDFDLWFGFLGPANLPSAIVRKWDDELAAVNALPDVQSALSNQGLAPMSLDSAATAALIRRDTARWREVIEKAGIKPE